MPWRRLTLVMTACLSLNCALIDDLLGTEIGDTAVSTERIAQGLKEALSVGIDSASSSLADSLRGYFLNEVVRILLPTDVAQAMSYLKTVQTRINGLDPITRGLVNGLMDVSGLTGMESALILSINRAAEHASPRSVPIFKDAIFGITIEDAKTILYGDSTEATRYLNGKTYSPLVALYAPFVDSTLALVGAHTLWNTFATGYNDFIVLYGQMNALVTAAGTSLPAPAVTALTTDLGEYTTGKALDGLFYMVGKEESRIRRDPIARVSELLRDVFGLLDS